MLVLLPFLGGALLLLVCFSWTRSWRNALLVSLTVWGCYLALTTELLAVFDGLTRRNVALAWMVLAAACVGILGPKARRAASSWQKPSLPGVWSIEGISLLAIVGVITLTGIVALVSPPNTWDVMDYHMPRVVQWIQRRNLSYHPVHYCPQLFYPPFAEWTILHFHLLSGSDRFSNLVQWTSFVGCIVASSYAADLLGAGRHGQWLAALLSATLPQAVLAASGSKNDLVAAFWVIAAGIFVLRFARARSLADVLFAGLALGLGILTKGTAYFFAPALLAGCLAGCVRDRAWPRALVVLLLIPLLVIALNARQYARNIEFSGSPAGLSSPNGDDYEKLRVENPTPRMIAANLVRNVALHLGTKSVRVNARMDSLLRGTIAALGVDPDDPRMTWQKFRVNQFGHNEYFAGSPLHLLLFIAIVLALAVRPNRWSMEAIAFVVGIIVSFGMFAAFFPWTIWSGRLHTTPLVFAAAAMGLCIERARRSIVIGVVIAAGALGASDLMLNNARPLITRGNVASIFTTDRWSQYFVNATWHQSSFTAAIKDIRHTSCRDIGIDASIDGSFEYPILRGLGVAAGEARVWDVGVTNVSGKTAGAFEARMPCAVLCLACTHHPEKVAQYAPRFPCKKAMDDLILFTSASEPGDSSLTSRCQ